VVEKLDCDTSGEGEMKESGILMTPENIAASAEGRKTQTRRTRGLDIINKPPQSMNNWQLVSVLQRDGETVARFITPDGNGDISLVCPYGGVGDFLYIKEAWSVCSFSEYFAASSQLLIAYKLGGQEWRTVNWETWQKYASSKYYSWQSPMFMPKLFARHWNEIISVRAERLQDMSYNDVKAEGIDMSLPDGFMKDEHWQLPENKDLPFGYMRFKYLWDSINKASGHPWEKNEWVWPIGYKAVSK